MFTYFFPPPSILFLITVQIISTRLPFIVMARYYDVEPLEHDAVISCTMWVIPSPIVTGRSKPLRITKTRMKPSWTSISGSIVSTKYSHQSLKVHLRSIVHPPLEFSRNLKYNEWRASLDSIRLKCDFFLLTSRSVRHATGLALEEKSIMDVRSKEMK